jgi:hypothetical protein
MREEAMQACNTQTHSFEAVLSRGRACMVIGRFFTAYVVLKQTVTLAVNIQATP